MIKIAAFSDAHFPKLVGIKGLKVLRNSVNNIDPDYVVIAGDLTEGEKESFEIFLKEFEEIDCPKLICLGNHDLWVQSFEEATSLEKMEEFIEMGESFGYHMLDNKPFLEKDSGFAGTVGWYDYSFADPQFPIKDIENKILFYKGDTFAASWWNDRFYFRLKKRNPLMEMTFTEDDNFFVDSLKIPRSSREEDTYFTKLCYKHLNKSLNKIKDAKIKIAVIHHLPFKELLNIGREKTIESLFFNAYMGSKCFGELMIEKKVDICICGHTHLDVRRKIHGIEVYNVSEIKRGIKKIEI